MVELSSLKSVSLSKFSDNVVVLHSKNEGSDNVFSVGAPGETHGELIFLSLWKILFQAQTLPASAWLFSSFDSLEEEGLTQKFIQI